MGTADVKRAFNAGLGDAGECHSLTMRYDGANGAQVFAYVVRMRDGTERQGVEYVPHHKDRHGRTVDEVMKQAGKRIADNHGS